MNVLLRRDKMTIKEFQDLNRERCYSDEAIKSWGNTKERTLKDWALCLAGESGELCNSVKKLYFYANKEELKEVSKEACDVITYAFLLLDYLDLDVEKELLEKFDEVSKRIGWKTR